MKVVVPGCLFLLVSLGGCANFGGLKDSLPFWKRETTLSLVSRMETLSDPGDRKQLAQSVKARYREKPTAENALRLAIILSLPGQDFSDDGQALVLLEGIDPKTLSPADRRISSWLGLNIKYRLALRQTNKELHTDLKSTHKALERAREKIEILTRIEKTMGPNPEKDE